MANDQHIFLTSTFVGRKTAMAVQQQLVLGIVCLSKLSYWPKVWYCSNFGSQLLEKCYWWSIFWLLCWYLFPSCFQAIWYNFSRSIVTILAPSHWKTVIVGHIFGSFAGTYFHLMFNIFSNKSDSNSLPIPLLNASIQLLIVKKYHRLPW